MQLEINQIRSKEPPVGTVLKSIFGIGLVVIIALKFALFAVEEIGYSAVRSGNNLNWWIDPKLMNILINTLLFLCSLAFLAVLMNNHSKQTKNPGNSRHN